MSKHDNIRHYPKLLLATAMTFAMFTPATADDTDVFNAVIAAQQKPNVMFALDYSGSMRDPADENDPNGLSRIDALKQAVNTLLQDQDIQENVNIGIGSVFSKEASGVRWPLSDLTADASITDPAIPAGQFTNAQIISKQLERSKVGGGTSTVAALVESAAYFRADEFTNNGHNFNQDRARFTPDTWDPIAEEYNSGNDWTAIPSSYEPTTAYDFGTLATNRDDTWTVPRYKPPIKQQCQSNFIVLVSDGVPTKLHKSPAMESVLQAAGLNGYDDCAELDAIFDMTKANSIEREAASRCGPEILRYLANNDIDPNIPGSSVKTYSVGFGITGSGRDYLELLANENNGDGEFFEANSPAELSMALNSIVGNIITESANFSELAIDIDTDNFSHDDRTYFSLFQPSPNTSWQGNLKGYFLDENGLVDVNGNPATELDASGLKFASTAQSFWSATPDGNGTVRGGASELITNLPPAPNLRNMYTNLGNGRQVLTADGNRIEKANANLSNAVLGNPAAGVRENALDWLANAPMGDPLHTKPSVVNYAGGDRVIYLMTNQGFLHAFDASTPVEPNTGTPDLSGGKELFAFMPYELLQNIPEIYGRETGSEHIYGLDGGLTRWHTDKNGNGIVDGDDTMLLVFGMRRGGNNYYAVDVTEPTRPEFKWQINSNTPGFAKLAQTWSRPSLIVVNHPDNDRLPEDKRVLVFGGGYDAAAVDNTNQATPSNGNAIFMVDEDGDLVWSVDNSHLNADTMEYSIPSDLTVLDSDSDGMADRIIVGDQGGQVWRVDFDDVTVGTDTHITLLADVKQRRRDHQPIFYPPSVSINNDNGQTFHAIAFGTGDRTDPLNPTSQNAFYMIRDTNYRKGRPETPHAVIGQRQIADLTENDIASMNDTVREAAELELEQKQGWKVNLGTGEKSLSAVNTFEGKLLATTFEPELAYADTGAINHCSFQSTSRLYIMDVLDARPIEIMADGSENRNGLDKTRRSNRLNGSTIPSTPVIIFPEDSSQVQILVDKESTIRVNRTLRTVFWHAK